MSTRDALWKRFHETEEGAAARAALLMRIADGGDLRDAWPLFEHAMWSTDGAEAIGASRALGALLRAVPTAAVGRCDRLLRASSSSLVPSALVDARARLERGDAAAAYAIACTHASGYVRAIAVRFAADGAAGALMRFVALRLFDWVPEVRAAAEATFETLLARRDSAALTAAWPVLEQHARSVRSRGTALVRRVAAVLREAESRDEVRAALKSPDAVLRRSAYGILVSGDAESGDLEALLAQAQSDADAEVRRWAADALRRLPPTHNRDELLHAALRDRAPVVRKAALNTCSALRVLPRDALPDILLDGQTSVRTQAARLLERVALDVAASEFYREAVRTKTRLRPALLGLGETGGVRDADAVLPFVHDRSPGVRAAALRALSRLAPDPHVDRFAAAVFDRHARVSNEATRALCRHAHLLTAAMRTLREHESVSGRAPHTARNTEALAKAADAYAARYLAGDAARG